MEFGKKEFTQFIEKMRDWKDKMIKNQDFNNPNFVDLIIDATLGHAWIIFSEIEAKQDKK